MILAGANRVSAAFQLRFSSLEVFILFGDFVWSQNIRVPQSQTFGQILFCVSAAFQLAKTGGSPSKTGVGRDESVADTRQYVFGRRKVGVARRPSAMEGAGGVGGAGAFGVLASRLKGGHGRWCMVVEEEVDITFLPPKPKVKVKKEKKKEKAAVKAAADAATAEEAACRG